MSIRARSGPLATLTALVVLVAGCASSGPSALPPASGAPSASPSSAPTSTPGDVDAIEHPTGASDVVLRFEEGGGFVAPGFLAIEAPIFTLYGDGTIVFRDPAQEPLPAVGPLMPLRPFRLAKLTEEQIQSTLRLAIRDGGLGIARANYPNNQVADAPTATFTLDAGGLHKTVSINGLGIEVPGVPDALARKAFKALAVRLTDFDNGGAIPTNVYAPERYRGVLLDGQPGDPNAVRWPWADLTPADFVAPADPNRFQIPVHVLTDAQAKALGIDPYQGGFQGPTITGPDGKSYAFSLRPLLPDEPS